VSKLALNQVFTLLKVILRSVLKFDLLESIILSHSLQNTHSRMTHPTGFKLTSSGSQDWIVTVA
jgi:hypothetical protein